MKNNYKDRTGLDQPIVDGFSYDYQFANNPYYGRANLLIYMQELRRSALYFNPRIYVAPAIPAGGGDPTGQLETAFQVSPGSWLWGIAGESQFQITEVCNGLRVFRKPVNLVSSLANGEANKVRYPKIMLLGTPKPITDPGILSVVNYGGSSSMLLFVAEPKDRHQAERFINTAATELIQQEANTKGYNYVGR
jgi:hypothetical protein